MLETNTGSSRDLHFLLSLCFQFIQQILIQRLCGGDSSGTHRLHLWAFSGCGEGATLWLRCAGFLTAVVSLVAKEILYFLIKQELVFAVEKCL